MAILRVPDKQIEIKNFEAIQNYLQEKGIWHDRWEAAIPFTPDASQETVLAAYAHVLEPYMQKNGYTVADVIVVHPQMENLAAIRAKFLKEHTHTEDEVRFFVEGRGWFWFHINGEVFHVECSAGDLLSVPAQMPHWFDLGTEPFVKAIRIFIDTSGWVPYYTETGIENKYLSLV